MKVKKRQKTLARVSFCLYNRKMYNYITGSVTHIEDGTITLNVAHNVGAVGYLVNASESLLDTTRIGDNLTAFVYFDIKETSHTLYGFSSVQERDFFKLLLTVNGVGTKCAMALMSSGTENLVKAITSRNSPALSKIKGVSAKIADKVILDLRAKVVKKFGGIDAGVHSVNNQSMPSEIQDAVFALMGLGMNKSVVEQLISCIDTADKSAEEIIKLCLQKRGA